jgi:hypothetical protein
MNESHAAQAICGGWRKQRTGAGWPSLVRCIDDFGDIGIYLREGLDITFGMTRWQARC